MEPFQNLLELFSSIDYVFGFNAAAFPHSGHLPFCCALFVQVVQNFFPQDVHLWVRLVRFPHSSQFPMSAIAYSSVKDRHRTVPLRG